MLITNSVSRKGSRRYGALVFLQRAKPNDRTRTRDVSQCDGTGWQSQRSDTSWANNETWYSLLQRSKTFLFLSVSGLKVSEPNNYSSITLARDRHHPWALSLLIMFINPPISSIQQWGKLLLHFQLLRLPPQPHYLSSSKSPLCLRFPFIPPAAPETQHTCRRTQQHAHWYSHTLASLVCVGGYQFDTGHCDYVFSVLQSGGGDKGPADHSKARHHSSDVGREAVVEGVKVAGGKDLYLIFFVCFNHFKSSFPTFINDNSSKWDSYSICLFYSLLLVTNYPKCAELRWARMDGTYDSGYDIK